MKKFFLGVFITLLIEAIGGIGLMWYYTQYGFNTEGVEEEYTIKNPLAVEKAGVNDIESINNKDLKIENIPNIWYKVVESKNDIKELVVTKKNLKNIYLQTKLASIKDKRLQNFVYNFFYFNGESEFKSFLFEKYKEELNFKSEEKDKLNIDDEEVFYTNFFNSIKTVEDLREKLSSVDLSKYQNQDYCYNDYCNSKIKDIKSIYKVSEKAFFNEKELHKYIVEDYEKYGFNPKLYYSIIMTENMRMYSTYKGKLKQILNTKVPKLPIMTQYSYGIFAVKNNLITKMMNENYEGSKFYIGWDDEVFNYIKDNFYTYNTSSKRWVLKNENGLINYITKDKKNQVRITTLYFLMQQTAWKEYIKDFNNNAGILTTLYNIGAFKEPHGEPKLGGANLGFFGYTISFGRVTEQMYYSTNFDYLMLELKNKLAK